MNKTIQLFAIIAIVMFIIISLVIRLAEGLKNLMSLLARLLDNPLPFSMVPDLEYVPATVK